MINYKEAVEALVKSWNDKVLKSPFPINPSHHNSSFLVEIFPFLDGPDYKIEIAAKDNKDEVLFGTAFILELDAFNDLREGQSEQIHQQLYERIFSEIVGMSFSKSFDNLMIRGRL